MPPLRLLLLAGLAGCDTIGPSIDGEWSGTCTIEGEGSYDAPDAVRFELEVFEEDGRVKGEGEFVYDGYEFEGNVRGMQHGDFVELELEGSSGGHSTRLEIVGDLIGDRLSGACSLYGTDGSLEMSR